MSESWSLIAQVGRKDVDKERLAEKIIRNPLRLPEIIAGLEADQADVKFGCAKILRIASEQQPQLIYPHIDVFIQLLNSENNILKWQAIHVIANLAIVDSDDRINTVLRKYLTPIKGDVMITAANVLAGAATIALAKPELTGRIVTQMLHTENAEYQTRQCRDIAVGHAITAMDRIFDQVKRQKPALDFVRRELDNPRAATRKKAEKFIKRWSD